MRPAPAVAGGLFALADLAPATRTRRLLRSPLSEASNNDRRVRRWCHLDLAGTKCWLEAEVRRLACRRCQRVRTEEVPWARPGARHSRDLQDVVTFMAQRMDKTTIIKLLRVSWEAVGRIVVGVVAAELDAARVDGLYCIGVDEVSYRKGHRYLTVVADHDRDGAVVWARQGKDGDTLRAFYDELGEQRCAQLEAVSLDMGGAYEAATADKATGARQCGCPSHESHYGGSWPPEPEENHLSSPLCRERPARRDRPSPAIGGHAP